MNSSKIAIIFCVLIFRNFVVAIIFLNMILVSSFNGTLLVLICLCHGGKNEVDN